METTLLARDAVITPTEPQPALNANGPHKPRIGITSGLSGDDWRPEGKYWSSYAEAIRANGGEPVYLNDSALGQESETLSDLDGIVFSGGVDIDLAAYPRPPVDPSEFAALAAREKVESNPERDRYEFALLAAALETGMPVLGICRGCQLMYVHRGGRLILDLPQAQPPRMSHRLEGKPEYGAEHPIELLGESCLAQALDGARATVVNSYHHQAALPGTANGVRVTAVAPDGTVEAIELEEHPWAVGVQWHPERALQPATVTKSAAILGAFIAAAVRRL